MPEASERRYVSLEESSRYDDEDGIFMFKRIHPAFYTIFTVLVALGLWGFVYLLINKLLELLRS